MGRHEEREFALAGTLQPGKSLAMESMPFKEGGNQNGGIEKGLSSEAGHLA